MNDKDKAAYSKEELVRQILEKDRDLKESNIDEELIHELISGKISKNINEADDENATLGQQIADKIATFGGSWTFIISFCVVLAVWIIGNAIILSNRAFDPYPFVFLNLVLSCLAAIQAPIIMMSQNRQSEKDRLTAGNNYLINLKSEIIVEDLHYKIDMLMDQQAENTKTIEMLLKTIEELKSMK
ncbi:MULTISPECIES: DUF1003 domain-containing protein [Clostridium]|uniref:DUF1003 domain-containing protein n=1 Tax=Clostridium ragsdalei P11 TaxID=1353534 RepID=A0A1A6AV69_9CLOT|nr:MULTISPECIES: DUF1003 domain-containing protein [Clostridium]OBR93933.1 hypothetical protein CLRAG_18360 [Clostridium ragsdalei P11]QXE17776.1 cyclic nucleotide-binding protein [Clostridium sp. 001]